MQLAKCEFKGKADYIVDYLIEIREAITELRGGDDD
jgi:hypothetical protein